jgi:hypothetical protein
MPLTVPVRSTGGWFLYAIAALFGIFLFVDAVVLLGFFVLSALTGDPLNPYMGIVMFLILPGIATAGAALCRWGYRHLSTSAPEARYEVQGR